MCFSPQFSPCVCSEHFRGGSWCPHGQILPEYWLHYQVWDVFPHCVQQVECVSYSDWFLFRYSGALCGLALVFVLPALIHMTSLKRRGELRWPSAVFHIFLILLGVANLLGQFFMWRPSVWVRGRSFQDESHSRHAWTLTNLSFTVVRCFVYERFWSPSHNLSLSDRRTECFICSFEMSVFTHSTISACSLSLILHFIHSFIPQNLCEWFTCQMKFSDLALTHVYVYYVQ